MRLGSLGLPTYVLPTTTTTTTVAPLPPHTLGCWPWGLSPSCFSLSASHDGIRALTTPVPFPLYV